MKIDRVSLTVFLSVPILIVLYLAFLWLTYIDESIYEGSGYGFVVGESKQQVYERIRMQHEKRPYIVLMVIDSDGKPIFLEPFEPSPENFTKIEQYDHWEFYLKFKTSNYDSITFWFHRNELERIHRHRKYFDTL